MNDHPNTPAPDQTHDLGAEPLEGSGFEHEPPTPPDGEAEPDD